MMVILRQERRGGGGDASETGQRVSRTVRPQAKQRNENPRKAKVKERGTYSTPQEGLRGPYSL